MNGINYATVLRLNGALLSLILVKFFVLSRYKLLGAMFFFEIMSDCFEFEKNPDIIRKMCTSKFHIASSYFFGKKAGVADWAVWACWADQPIGWVLLGCRLNARRRWFCLGRAVYTAEQTRRYLV